MRSFDSKSLLDRQISMIVQYALEDVLCESVEFHPDQQIRESVESSDDAEFLFDILHDSFVRTRTAHLKKKAMISEMMPIWERGAFRDLFDLLSMRYQPISIERVTVFGNPCLTAGVFRSCERIVERVTPRTPRVSPSTPIYPTLQGKAVRTFLSELYLATGGFFKPSQQVQRVDTVVSALTLLSVLAILPLMFFGSIQLLENLPMLPAGLLCSFFCMFGTAAICLGLQEIYRKVLDRWMGLLPTKTYTFRDLAYDVERVLQP